MNYFSDLFTIHSIVIYSVDQSRIQDSSGSLQAPKYHLKSTLLIETMSLSSKESLGISWYDERGCRKDARNLGNQEIMSSRRVKAMEHSRNALSKWNVKGALVKPKGCESTVIEVKKESKECASRDVTSKIQEKELEKSGDIIQERNRKEAFEKRSPKFVTALEFSDEASEVRTAKAEPEAACYALENVTVENNAKRFVRVVKNRLILPIRLQQQTRRRKRKESDSSHGHERRCVDNESALEENIEEKTAMGAIEEENVETNANITPLSAGKLQQLIREKVLSQSQTSSKRGTNQKTAILNDYLGTLAKHMGTADGIPESNSPDFSKTPFMAAGKKHEQRGGIPTTMQRRLEMLRQQIARLPASYTLLDGDLVED